MQLKYLISNVATMQMYKTAPINTTISELFYELESFRTMESLSQPAL
jgi:hypothetical protein